MLYDPVVLRSREETKSKSRIGFDFIDFYEEVGVRIGVCVVLDE